MNVKIAAIQMAVTDNKKDNIDLMITQVAKCAKEKAQIIVLPEMFCCPYNNESFIINKESAGEYIWSALSNVAKDNGVYLFGGSMPEEDDGKIYNTCFIFNPKGEQIGMHRKMHLFDINVRGGQTFKESDVFSRGNSVTVVDTEFGKIGAMICFDMRFPELSRLMVLQGAKIICVPAAFNMTTGPAHWEVHFRSRAIDNQVYMIGCAPSKPENGYQAYGHSILVSPWGNVLEQLDFSPNIFVKEIDLDEVEKIREQLPLLSARREDIYKLDLK